MIDIHCHILPGLDDGSESLEMSLEMAEMAISEGITHVIATPHANANFPFIPELVRERRYDMQARLANRLEIATGCDFHLSYENIKELCRDPKRFTLNQKDFILVELADFSIPASMDQILHQLQLARLFPVITHPERNPLIRSQPERLEGWLRRGCHAQVTAQSITGGFGQKAKEAAEAWLDAEAVHFVASDAHNLTSRPLRLRAAFDAVSERRGEAVAQALFEANPRAALEGRPLPYAPEPGKLKSLAWNRAASRARKRFWFF